MMNYDLWQRLFIQLLSGFIYVFSWRACQVMFCHNICGNVAQTIRLVAATSIYEFGQK